ncbi:MAG: DMT family transporter [Oscillatoriaceae cyanobacterium Prado104]|jgi:drug/metabolite transporter (DMT)-like permease|nr:DMT family transporter [Oscillatoriaceae cyanobacterium Prado104]
MSNKLGLPEKNLEKTSQISELDNLDRGLKPLDEIRIVSAKRESAIAGKSAQNKNDFWTVVALLVAMTAVSFAAIFIRFSEQELSANATVFNRLWIATVVFAIWNGVVATRSRKSEAEIAGRSSYNLRDLMLLLAVGVVSSTSLGFWAWSLTQTNVASSTLLRNFTPLFTTLGSWLLFGRCFDRRFLVGMTVALAGAGAIGLQDLQIAGDNLVGDFAALLAAMFYAGNMLIVENLRSKFPATIISMWRCVIGSILILPLVLLAGDRVFPYSWQGWLAAIALGVICQALGQGLLTHSLGRLSSGFVGLVLLLEPAFTAILAWLLFSESLSWLKLLYFALVLCGIYLAKSSKSIDKK